MLYIFVRFNVAFWFVPLKVVLIFIIIGFPSSSRIGSPFPSLNYKSPDLLKLDIFKVKFIVLLPDVNINDKKEIEN